MAKLPTGVLVLDPTSVVFDRALLVFNRFLVGIVFGERFRSGDHRARGTGPGVALFVCINQMVIPATLTR